MKILNNKLSKLFLNICFIYDIDYIYSTKNINSVNPDVNFSFNLIILWWFIHFKRNICLQQQQQNEKRKC